MNERNRNIIVGLTTAVALIGLMFLLLVFGYVPSLMKGGYIVNIELDDALGLNPGSRVELSGIDIGAVETVDFKQPLGTGVTVAVRITEDDTLVPVSARAIIEKPLLGGSPTIRFVTNSQNGTPKAFLKKDGSAVVPGSLGALAGIFGELTRVADSFDRLSAEWRNVGEKLNGLLDPQDLAAVEAGEAPGNVTTVIARVDKRLAEFREVLAGIDSLVNDPQLRDDVTATASNARQASEDIAGAMASLEKRYVALADDVSGMIEQVNKLVETANSEEGSFGKVMQDPALYNSLEDAAKRIGTAADELKLLIEKWKAEGVPVSL
ncbi:MlaD family protein [Algisphaera agarilytica]|uniref:Phospholipid/cholesterol/gamma-HCH transport system substrate-binding protein n=1 Tax=Algisphaera agarilytica TaxID=1385975 RepID=A0A7X0H7H9_9BACT|nr:MlaD family protein [Algisphaera agarilytica]MBB6430528.1 phospholipid/cholesterol/gamma-HCH transport system substrate-binding protein [Algisphaera agarilytica]